MKVIFTRHVLEKLILLKDLGWNITKTQIRETVIAPRWKGRSKHGDETAMVLIGDKHILRVIFKKKDDTKTKTEWIIFLTPHIITANNPPATASSGK